MGLFTLDLVLLGNVSKDDEEDALSLWLCLCICLVWLGCGAVSHRTPCINFPWVFMMLGWVVFSRDGDGGGRAQCSPLLAKFFFRGVSWLSFCVWRTQKACALRVRRFRIPDNPISRVSPIPIPNQQRSRCCWIWSSITRREPIANYVVPQSTHHHNTPFVPAELTALHTHTSYPHVHHPLVCVGPLCVAAPASAHISTGVVPRTQYIFPTCFGATVPWLCISSRRRRQSAFTTTGWLWVALSLEHCIARSLLLRWALVGWLVVVLVVCRVARCVCTKRTPIAYYIHTRQNTYIYSCLLFRPMKKTSSYT